MSKLPADAFVSGLDTRVFVPSSASTYAEAFLAAAVHVPDKRSRRPSPIKTPMLPGTRAVDEGATEMKEALRIRVEDELSGADIDDDDDDGTESWVKITPLSHLPGEKM